MVTAGFHAITWLLTERERRGGGGDEEEEEGGMCQSSFSAGESGEMTVLDGDGV